LGPIAIGGRVRYETHEHIREVELTQGSQKYNSATLGPNSAIFGDANTVHVAPGLVVDINP
jgi:hypothetical protein